MCYLCKDPNCIAGEDCRIQPEGLTSNQSGNWDQLPDKEEITRLRNIARNSVENINKQKKKFCCSSGCPNCSWTGFKYE